MNKPQVQQGVKISVGAKHADRNGGGHKVVEATIQI